jgi:hypothetical protein
MLDLYADQGPDVVQHNLCIGERSQNHRAVLVQPKKAENRNIMAQYSLLTGSSFTPYFGIAQELKNQQGTQGDR